MASLVVALTNHDFDRFSLVTVPSTSPRRPGMYSLNDLAPKVRFETPVAMNGGKGAWGSHELFVDAFLRAARSLAWV